MSRPRFEKMDAERQKRLFDSTAKEFASHGFDGASLNLILEQSGMSKSSLYYYFDDKADLFTTMIERAIAVFFKEVGGFNPEALTAENFWSAHEDLYRRSIEVACKNLWLMQFGGMFYRLRGDSKNGSATGRVFNAARQWVSRILTRGQTVGAVRTDMPQTLLVDMTMALVESLDRWVVGNWAQLAKNEIDELPSKHIELMRQLLTSEARSSRTG